MSANPYQSPLLHDLTLPAEPALDDGRRPIGVWLLSMLHLVGGVMCVVGMCFVLFEAFTIDTPVEPSPWVMLIFLVVYGFLLSGSGLGMWLGARWGWWLGNFVYTWNLVVALAQIPILLWNTGGQIIAAEPSWLLQKGIGLAINLLIVLYFFKRSVRDFFRLRSLNVLYALLLLGLVSILFLAGQMALAYAEGEPV